MSLYNSKLCMVETKFKYCLGIDWLHIGRSDCKTDKSGRTYRFSQFDMECNVFKSLGNTFSGDIRVVRRHRGARCSLFQKDTKGKSCRAKLGRERHL